jgi:hypothetical protein
VRERRLLAAFEDGAQQVRLPADKKIGLLQWWVSPGGA